MKKGFLGILLTVAMLCSSSFLFTTATAQDMIPAPVKFNDVSSHWSKDTVQKLSEKGAIPFQEMQFLPDKAIKKFEFALMLHKALDIQINYFKEPNIKDYFDDIKQDAPYASAVIDLVTANIFEGKGNFKPEEALPKEEMVHYIMRAYQYKMADNFETIKIGPATFKDADKIDTEYSGDVARAQHYGLIVGNGNNLFQPKKSATRAETAVVISRLMELLEKQNKVTVEPKAFIKDEAIEMKITINNNTKNDIVITNISGQKFDFELLDANKKALYRWSADKTFIMALTTTKIEAGKSMEFSDTLSGDAYQAIKDKIVFLKAYITGKAEFINANGYEINLK
jgi:hypothetical protein